MRIKKLANFSQKQFWTFHQFNRAQDFYNEVFIYDASLSLDQPRFIKAFKRTVESCDALNQYIVHEEGSLYSISSSFQGSGFIKRAECDVSNIDEVTQLCASKAFDLGKPPLYRLHLLETEEYIRIIMIIHHIVLDGNYFSRFIDLISYYYNNIENSSCLEYFEDIDIVEEPDAFAEDYSLFEKYKEEIPDISVLQSSGVCSNIFNLGHELSRQLKIKLKAYGLTEFQYLLTVYTIVLAKYLDKKRLLITYPVNLNKNHSRAIGCYINNMIWDAVIELSSTFLDISNEVKNHSNRSKKKSNISFNMQVAKYKKLMNLPEYEVGLCFASSDLKLKPMILDGLDIKPVFFHKLSSPFMIFMQYQNIDDNYYFNLMVSNDLPNGSDYLEDLFMHVLEASIVNPNFTINKLDVIRYKKSEDVLCLLQDKNINQAFDLLSSINAIVDAYPNKIAIRSEGDSITYQELHDRSNAVATFLLTNFSQPELLDGDIRIGLYLGISPWQIICMMACILLGIPYVPINTAYPKAYLEQIIDNAKLSLLIVDESIVADNIKLVNVNNLDLKTCCKVGKITDDTRPAYILYTSGTTDLPKGVVIHRKNILELISSTKHYFKFDHQDKHVLFHNYAFDFSVWEIWSSLLTGGELCMPNLSDKINFLQYLIKHKITVLNQTPSALRQLIWMNQDCMDVSKENIQLRCVILGGEAAYISDYYAWQEFYNNPGCKIYNMFGITEDTVHSSIYGFDHMHYEHISCIGVPLPGKCFFVVNQEHQLLPPGVAGELLIGGVGLAEGYFADTEATQNTFVTVTINNIKMRLLKTGDIACYDAKGNYYYMGRKNNTIKYLGFRINTSVIAQHTLTLTGVTQCNVLMHERGDRTSILCLYYTGTAGESEVRQHLVNVIPSYMVPNSIVKLDNIPMTTNSKVDIDYLTKLNHKDHQITEYENYSDLMDQVKIVWESVLEKSIHSTDKTFFDLGGTSVLLFDLLIRLKASMNIELTIQDLFRYSTIGRLAKYIYNGNEQVDLDNKNMATRRQFNSFNRRDLIGK